MNRQGARKTYANRQGAKDTKSPLMNRQGAKSAKENQCKKLTWPFLSLCILGALGALAVRIGFPGVLGALAPWRFNV